MAGLQVRYVFAYPEQKDIVLVGPAEGWKVDARGNVVGATTGRPVMLLDDLLVALRTAGAAARGGITCSIDPTGEGHAAVAGLRGQAAHDRQPGRPPRRASSRRWAGSRSVSPACRHSHFAGVLLAADYRMKRLAMNFEPSPVRGLPSFLTWSAAPAAA